MRIHKVLLFTTFCISIASCEDPIVGTSPPPAPPPPVEETNPPPPPVVRGPSFSYENVRGVLLFAGIQGSGSQLRGLIADFRTAWPRKQLAFNVCSETTEWEQTPWADGPPALGEENLGNLRRFLRVTAEEGVMVRLNIFCTLRDNGSWMQKNWQKYTRIVVDIAKEYDHIILSVANEPYHPNSWLRSGKRVDNVVFEARAAGWRGLVTTDDTLSPRRVDYRYAYSHLGLVPDFHPFRNPDPRPSDFDRLKDTNGFLVISEPTAYSTWREGGCCTSSKQDILTYLRRAERRGIVWFYHSTSGLEWPQGEFKWIPNP